MLIDIWDVFLFMLISFWLDVIIFIFLLDYFVITTSMHPFLYQLGISFSMISFIGSFLWLRMSKEMLSSFQNHLFTVKSQACACETGCKCNRNQLKKS